MRITFISPFASLAGGVRVIAMYARELERRGHHVTVVSTPAPRRPLRQRLQGIFRGELRARLPQPTPLLDFLGDRHVIARQPRLVTAADVPDGDVVIATWWETAEWVRDLPASKGRKFYLLQGYDIGDNRPNERIAATYDAGLRMIAVSNYVRSVILENHVPRADIAVVPNAVDMEQFHAPPRTRNAVPTIGFIYSRAPIKNTALAIEALERLRREFPRVRALCFGRDPVRPEIPLPGWIEHHLCPDQDLIPRLYAACDLWLFPTLREGFGLPLLEAMACRTPVLATAAGAAPELVDGRNGLILPSDADVFAAEMARFLRMSPEEWVNWSEAAVRTARQHTWDKAAERLLAVLSEA